MSILKNHPMLRSLKATFKKSPTYVEGTIYNSGKGFGFLNVSKQERYFIPSEEMKWAVHGDKVKGLVVTTNEGKERVKLQTLISTPLNRFIGKLIKLNGQWMVVYEVAGLKYQFKIALTEMIPSTWSEGAFVEAKLQQHPLLVPRSKDQKIPAWIVDITEVIAQGQEKWGYYKAALSKFELAFCEPMLEKEAQLVCDDADAARLDLTDWPFVTIDGTSTQDMDDAIYAEVSRDPSQGIVLHVAIADPTTFIGINSTLEIEAAKRAFSVYFPGFSVPMLPRYLSESVCSLRAKVDRHALVCSVQVDVAGNLCLDSIAFNLAKIRSSARLSYEEVSNWLEGQQTSTAITKLSNRAKTSLKCLYQFAQQRSQLRSSENVELFNRPEYRFILDDAGKVINIVTERKRSAHLLVEEAMIAANLCCAHFLSERLGKGVFSGHVGINPKDKAGLQDLLEALSTRHEKIEDCFTLSGYQQLKKQLGQEASLYYVERLKKMQMPSHFAIKPQVHFGLGVEKYATWTSPMRKYGDLLNHRLLKSAIQASKETCEHLLTPVQLKHLEAARKQAKLAEREVQAELYRRFLKNKVGETFESYILDVGAKGLKVRLEANGAICFLPLNALRAVHPDIVCDSENGVVWYKNTLCCGLGDTLSVVLDQIRPAPRPCTVRLSEASSKAWAEHIAQAAAERKGTATQSVQDLIYSSLQSVTRSQ